MVCAAKRYGPEWATSARNTADPEASNRNQTHNGATTPGTLAPLAGRKVRSAQVGYQSDLRLPTANERISPDTANLGRLGKGGYCLTRFFLRKKT